MRKHVIAFLRSPMSLGTEKCYVKFMIIKKAHHYRLANFYHEIKVN